MELKVKRFWVELDGSTTLVKITTNDDIEAVVTLDIAQALVLQSLLAATNKEATIADIKERLRGDS